MKTWTLRTKFTLWSALVTVVALLTFGLVAATNLYFQQVHAIDQRLAASAKEFLAEAAQKNPTELAELIRHDDEPHYGFALFNAGRVESGEPEALAQRLVNRTPRKTFTTLRLDDKFLRLGYFPSGDRALLLAADLHPVFHSLGELSEAYLLALPLVLLVIAGGSWWIAHRALAPVVAIATAASAITADKLATRLPVPTADDELARLTRVLNEMFDRLQRGFEQATRFSADASHELRTPLTILRGEIEEALRTGQFSGEQEKILVSLLEQVGGLQKISDNLLLLARFDAGKIPLPTRVLDFSALAHDAAEDAELLAAPLSLKIHAAIAPELRVAGDEVLLRRLLLNLVDNAVRYNRPGGEVWLALRRENSVLVLTLVNTGAGLPAEKRGELFQRFFRLDADRNRTSGGSGLGLSLCREITAAHGGAIELARSEADATEFVVRLPVS